MESEEEIIKNLISQIQEEFCQTLRKKYDLYPFICEFGSNALLAYLSHLLDSELVKTGSVNFGWYAHPTNKDACGNHSWIQIDDLIIDPTYEQFDESYKDKVRIVYLSELDPNEYKLYEACPIIARFVKRTKGVSSLREYLDKFEGHPIKN